MSTFTLEEAVIANFLKRNFFSPLLTIAFDFSKQHLLIITTLNQRLNKPLGDLFANVCTSTVMVHHFVNYEKKNFLFSIVRKKKNNNNRVCKCKSRA